MYCSFFFQAEDGIRDSSVTGVQTCALPILTRKAARLRERPSYGTLSLSGRSHRPEIGRASCRERGEISVVAVSLKKKNRTNDGGASGVSVGSAWHDQDLARRGC